MRSFSLREAVFAAGTLVIALLVLVWLGLHGAGFADWNAEARPAVDALLTGHGIQFLQLSPIYGASLILRVPFLLSTKLWHAGNSAVYVASAAPCIAATAALGLWLGARMRTRHCSLLACGVAMALCIANPLAVPALQLGHPEDLLGAVLCIAAVLCALSDRPIWAAVLLGAAIPNKEWALLAVGPVLVALPRAHLRTLLTTGAVAGALLAPLLLRASSGFVAQASAAGLNTGAIFQPWQLWWFLGTRGHTVYNVIGGYRIPPGWVMSLGHTLVIAVMPPLSVLYARLRRTRAPGRPQDVLLLLALLLALRCVLDPWDISYYSLPSLLALLTWEALSFDRPPVLAVTASFAAWLVFRETGLGALNLSPDAQAAAFTVVSIPAVIWLAAAVYAPRVLTRLAGHPRPGTTSAAPGWTHAATREAGVGT
jgi:hypothetical protein